MSCRYLVRLRVGDDEECLWAVYDTVYRVYVAAHSREQLALIVASRLESQHRRRLDRATAVRS